MNYCQSAKYSKIDCAQWNILITKSRNNVTCYVCLVMYVSLCMSRKFNRIIDDAVMEVSIQKSHYNDNLISLIVAMDLVLIEAYHSYKISLCRKLQ